jgi:phosphocarrier protein
MSKAFSVLNRTVTIINKLGLHARAAARFVTLASSFTSDIKVARNGQEVNGKSIMGVMMLAASKGTEITLIANGSDEKDAIDGLIELIRQRFGESE